MSYCNQQRMLEADTSFRSSTYSTSWMSIRSMYSVSRRSKDSETLRVTRGPVKSAGCPGPYFPTCYQANSDQNLVQTTLLCYTVVIKSGHCRPMRHSEPLLSVCSKIASAEA